MRQRAVLTMLAAAVAGVIGFAVYVVASSRTAGVPPTLVETTPSPTVPFGQLAVGRDDTLYFVEGQLGRIDVATKNGTKVSLSSLDGSYAADGSIPDLGAIVVTSDAPWFTANGSLYEANLGGHDVRRVAAASTGAIQLVVLPDGTIYYSTNSRDFERTPSGVTRRVAGGGNVGFPEQRSPHAAVDEGVDPEFIAGVDANDFYFTNENELYRVKEGIATQLQFLYRGSFFNGELTQTPGARSMASATGQCAGSMARRSLCSSVCRPDCPRPPTSTADLSRRTPSPRRRMATSTRPSTIDRLRLRPGSSRCPTPDGCFASSSIATSALTTNVRALG